MHISQSSWSGWLIKLACWGAILVPMGVSRGLAKVSVVEGKIVASDDDIDE